MPYLIADIPYTYCLVRSEFLRDDKEGHGEFEDACIFGVTALEGRLPSFQAMMKNGAQWARLPLHAFCTKECEPLPASTLVLWDCLSYKIAVHEYRYLSTLVCDVFCGDGQMRRGTYMFTLDWAESDYSETPDQHKSHHVIELESGHIAAMPNNRIRWHEPSWIKPFESPPDYKVQTRTFTAERERALKDGERMFYRQEGEPAGPISIMERSNPKGTAGEADGATEQLQA